MYILRSYIWKTVLNSKDIKQKLRPFCANMDMLFIILTLTPVSSVNQNLLSDFWYAYIVQNFVP